MATASGEDMMIESAGTTQNGDQTATSDDIADFSADMPEYEAQFFGFTPQAFVDGIYNALVEYLYDSLNVVEKYIIQEYNLDKADSGTSTEQVRKGSQKIFARLKDEIARSFDKLEGYMISNIFHIPSYIVLPEDKVHLEHNYTESDEEKLDQELIELRKKIRNVKYMNKWMMDSMKNMELIQGKMNQLKSLLEELEKAQKDAGVTDLKEALVFNVSRLKQLQDNVKSIMSHHVHTDDEKTEDPIKRMSKRLRLKQSIHS